MKPILQKISQRIKRKKHVRKKVVGTTARPRLTVFRSNKNIYAQIIDDSVGQTLVASSTRESAVATTLPGLASNRAAAGVIGKALAEKAVGKGIKQVVFDRNGYAYHGRVKELAEAARKGGLEF
ncbi:MAG: 50S ribosomal protein L18 [Phycisphaerae bacterium]|nr:50S ribosomal protein L18 [Phycisphaerae bacterium]